MNAAGTIRVLLVDRQPSVRRGLRMRFALEEDLEVVGEAGDVAEAIPLARALRPDVILMDIEMPNVSGEAATGWLRRAAPRSAVVIFTLRDDPATRERARAAGAASFVAKHRTEELLLAAIRGAAGASAKHSQHHRSVTGSEESADDAREDRSS